MQDKIYKSVIGVVTVNVCGYFVNFAMAFIAVALLQWPFNALFLEFGAIVLNLAAASNAFILYKTKLFALERVFLFGMGNFLYIHTFQTLLYPPTTVLVNK